MSLKTCSFDMDVPRGVSLPRPLAEGAPAVFEHLLEVFAPRVLCARANRGTILPVLAGIPGCLGLTADQVRWSNGGDYAPLFPGDAAELRGIWLPRLLAA